MMLSINPSSVMTFLTSSTGPCFSDVFFNVLHYVPQFVFSAPNYMV
jgi:hypothetical protein